MPDNPILIDEPIPDNLRIDTGNSTPIFVDEPISDNNRIQSGIEMQQEQKQLQDTYAQEIKAYTPETDPQGIKAAVLVEPYKVPFDKSGSIYFGYENMTPHQQVDRMKRVINPYDQDVEYYMTELEKVQKAKADRLKDIFPVLGASKLNLTDDEIKSLEGMSASEAMDFTVKKEMENIKDFSRSPSETMLQNVSQEMTQAHPNEVLEAKKETADTYTLKAREIFLKNKLNVAKYYQKKYAEERPDTKSAGLLRKAGEQTLASGASFVTGAANIVRSVTPDALVPDIVDRTLEAFNAKVAEGQRYIETLYAPSDERAKQWKEGELWKQPDRVAYMLVQNSLPMIVSLAVGGGATKLAANAGKLQKVFNAVSFGMGEAFATGLQNAGDAVKEAKIKGATPEQQQNIAQEVFIKDFTMNSFVNAVQFGSGAHAIASKTPFWNKMLKGIGTFGVSGAIEAETELRENEHTAEALAARGLANLEKINPSLYPRIVEALYDPEKRDIATFAAITGFAEPAMGAYHRIKQSVLVSGRGKAALDTVTNFINKKNKEIIAGNIEAQQQNAETATLPPPEDMSNFEATLNQQKEQLEAQFNDRERGIRTKYADDIETREWELTMLNAEKMKRIEELNSIQGFVSDGRVSEEARQKILDLTDPTEKATGDEINEVAQAMSGMTKEEFFRMRNEDIAALREKLGLNELSKAQAITFNDIFTNASTLDMSKRADDFATRILAEPEDRLNQGIPISVSERAGMLMESNKLQQQIQENIIKSDNLRKEGKTSEALEIEENTSNLIERFDKISNAMSRVQSAAGTFLGSIRMKLTPENNLYTAMAMVEKIKSAPLSPETKQAFIDNFKRQEELVKEIDKLEEERANHEEIHKQIANEANEAIGEMVAEAKATDEDYTVLAENIINSETILSQKSDRVSDMADLDADTKLEIQDLADLYIRELLHNGQKPDAKVLLERFKEVLPDVSDIQLLDAFSGRRKKALKKKLSEYEQIEKDLKQQSKLIAQIEEAIQGEFDPFNPPDPKSSKVIELQDQLQELKNQNAKTEIDPRKQAFYESKINELQDILFDYEHLGETYWSTKRKVQAEDNPEIRALKKQSLELQRKIRQLEQKKTGKGKKSDEAKIADMKQTLERLQADIDNLRQGKYPEKVKKARESEVVMAMRKKVRELRSLLHTEIKIKQIQDTKGDITKLKELTKVNPRPVPQNEELLKKRMELFHLQRTVKGMIEDAKTFKDMTWSERIYHSFGLLRTLKLTSDTPVLRQGKYSMWRDPKATYANFELSMKIYGETLKGGRDAGYKIFNDVMFAIQHDPLWTEMQQVKLPITDPHSGMNNREEIMVHGRFAEKIPIKKDGKFMDNRVVIGSELAYTAYLNLERVKYYKMLVQPGMTLEEKQHIARYVGTATGRGTFKDFERHALAASKALLAPRWYVANIQMGGGIIMTNMFWKSPTVRKSWYRDVGTHIVSRVAFIALGVAAGGKTEWTDANDPLFGKLQIGKTVIDPFGGSLWVWKSIIALSQKPENVWEVAGRQFQYKLNPVISSSFTFLAGKDVTGQEINRLTYPVESLTPIMLSNFYEAIKNENYMEAPLQLGIDFMGGSSYIKTPRKRRKSKKSRSQLISDKLL